MKKITLIMMSAAVIFAASCKKQDTYVIDDKIENSPEEVEETILYADFEDDEISKTAAYLHDGKTTPRFVAGDQMKIYTSAGSAIGTVTSVGEDGLAAISVSGISLTGDVYAIYPLSAAIGNNSTDMKFTIPETQHGTFAEANISAAKLNGTRFTFKNVTSVFKVTAKPEVITNFVFEKTGIAGTFSINFNDYSISAASAANKITVNDIQGSGPYYIAVATGLSYSQDELVANYYNSKNVHPVGYKNSAKKIGPFVRSKIYNLGDAKLNYSLDGKFSISKDGDLVYFAKGNMYWDGDSYEFEENQWDINYTWDPNHVTHFYFCTDQANAHAQTYFDPWGMYTTTNDILFTNVTATTPNPDLVISGDKGLWRALSINEWNYLIGTLDYKGEARVVNGGTGPGYTFDFAMINGEDYYGTGGVYGIVIYDDGYKGTVERHNIVTPADPYGLNGVVGVTEIPENSVFIPGNGVRDGVGSDGTEWYNHICGYYWTSESAKVDGMVSANICAHTFDYSDNGNLYNTDSWYRAYGSCIRPVADVQ